MRIRTICASALLTVALPFGTGMACAQGWAPYSNQGPPPGYAAPGAPYGAPGYAPYGAPGYAPYGPPQAYPPNYPAYPVYPNYYPAGPQGYMPPGMIPAMPVSQMPPNGIPAYAVPFTGQVPQGTPPGGTPPAATPPGEKIGPPAGKAAPETLPSVGEPFLDAGEPMIRIVGPNNPGVLPPLRNAVPERIGGERFWFTGGYMLSFMRSEKFATPIATTGSTLDPHAAGIGQPSTAVLIGGDNADFGMLQGIRLGAGIYLGDGQCWSVEGSGFYIFPESLRFTANSNATGNPIIARPIFDTNRGFERAFVDALPGLASGGVAVDVRTQFEGAEANLGYHYRMSEQIRLDGLFGFRYLRLSDDLTIQDRLTALRGGSIRFLGAPLNAGDVLSDSDNFQTTNQFYGLQIGGRAQWECERLFANAFAKLGFGINDQHVNINGQTVRSGPGGTQVAPGGILALSSNSGAHSRTTFGFVPETGFDIGVRLTPHVRLTAGYSFLVWTGVARPGNQLNRNVNTTLVPSDNSFGQAGGAPSPLFSFNNETFWLHSFNFGLDFQF